METLIGRLSIRALYLKISELYRQNPTDFDKLTTTLMTFVEPISFITSHLQKPLSELDEIERMQMLNDDIR